jgi:hypothetical protein
MLPKTHQKLDAAVDAAYAQRKFSGDRDRVAFLFTLYQPLISPLSASAPKTTRRQSQTHSVNS